MIIELTDSEINKILVNKGINMALEQVLEEARETCNRKFCHNGEAGCVQCFNANAHCKTFLQVTNVRKRNDIPIEVEEGVLK